MAIASGEIIIATSRNKKNLPRFYQEGQSDVDNGNP